MNLHELLEETINGRQEADETTEPLPLLQQEARATHLQELLATWKCKKPLAIGDLVAKDPAFGFNYKYPSHRYPGIVLETFSPPLPCNDKTGMEEQKDVLVGVIDPDGDFCRYALSSRALVLWEPKE